MIRAWIKYFYWRVYYKLAPKPTTCDEYLKALQRCWRPNAKFNPYIYKNDDSPIWHIYFAEDPDYVIPDCDIKADIHISMETGKIVGLTILQDELEKLSEPYRTTDTT